MFKLLIVSLLCFFGKVVCLEPEAVYLSWIDDPTQSMVIHWMDENSSSSYVYYQKEGDKEWVKQEDVLRVVQESPMRIHVVELTGLSQDKGYLFRIGEEEKIYKFQTLREDGIVTFAVGGDAYYKRELFEKMNAQVAKQNPDFVIMGGDIAYTVGGGRGILKGKEWEINRWKAFFKEWEKGLVKTSGELIPIIPIVGNHDVRKGEAHSMFLTVFSFPKKGQVYQVVDIGPNVSLFLLDTGHISPIEGEQTDWLKNVLEDRKGRRIKIAAYHIAAFPSFYPYEKATCVKLRTYWVPLFEEYGVKLAFEHHNHCYKRSHPIKNEEINEEGVVYFGDGSWGIPPRTPLKSSVVWYLAETKSENACFLVKVNQGDILVEPRRNNGKLVEAPIKISLK